MELRRKLPLRANDVLSPRVRYCVRALKRAQKAVIDGRIEKVWYSDKWIRAINRAGSLGLDKLT